MKEVGKIKDACIVIAGQSPLGSSYNNSGEGMEFHQGKKAFGESIIEHSNVWTTKITKIAEPGDILISVRAPVGPTNITDRKLCIGRGLAAIRCKGDVIPQYILYALRNIEYKIIGNDGAVFNSINKKQIEDLPLPLLSLSEQQSIVDYLDSTFAHIETLKANAEKQLHEARALFQKALERAMKPKEGWEEKKIGDVIDHLRTGLNPRTHFKLNTPDADGYYITVRELKGFAIEPDERTDKVNSAAIKRINERSNLKIGDVLFSGTGTIGKTALVSEFPKNWNIKEGVYAMTPKHSELDSKYFIYYIGSEFFLRLVNDKAAGTGVRSIPMKELVKLPLFIPSISVQQRIVARLDTLSANLRELENIQRKTIAECDALKQALLRKVFE